MKAAFRDDPLVGEIRGVGLMIGIELVKDKATKEAFPASDRVGRRVLQAAAKEGLITRALGDTLVFAPPLVINHAEIDELVQKFKQAVEAVRGTVA